MKRRWSRYQRRWLRVYWSAASLNVLFFLFAVTGGGVPGPAFLAVTLGALASLLGASMASHLMRRRISDRDFDDATSLMRVVSVAWLVLAGTIVMVTLVAGGFGQRSPGPGATQAVIEISDSVSAQLFGAAALLLVVGDGYTKYRRLLADSDSTEPPAPRAVPVRPAPARSPRRRPR